MTELKNNSTSYCTGTLYSSELLYEQLRYGQFSGGRLRALSLRWHCEYWT